MFVVVLFADYCWPLVTILAHATLSTLTTSTWYIWPRCCCLAILLVDMLHWESILLMIVLFPPTFTWLRILCPFIGSWSTSLEALLFEVWFVRISLLCLPSVISFSPSLVPSFKVVIISINATLGSILAFSCSKSILASLHLLFGQTRHIVSISFSGWSLLLTAFKRLRMRLFWAVFVHVDRVTSSISIIIVWTDKLGLVGLIVVILHCALILVVVTMLFLTG